MNSNKSSWLVFSYTSNILPKICGLHQWISDYLLKVSKKKNMLPTAITKCKHKIWLVSVFKQTRPKKVAACLYHRNFIKGRFALLTSPQKDSILLSYLCYLLFTRLAAIPVLVPSSTRESSLQLKLSMLLLSSNVVPLSSRAVRRGVK
jgi:hypothetical protein